MSLDFIFLFCFLKEDDMALYLIVMKSGWGAIHVNSFVEVLINVPN